MLFFVFSVFGKADPFLVFNVKEKKGKKFLTKTEVVTKSLSPQWNVCLSFFLFLFYFLIFFLIPSL